MFAKPTRQRLTLLSTLVLMSAALLGGCSAAPAADTEAVAMAASSEEMSVEQSVAACRPSCYGPCWSCILGVCENTCM